MHKLELTLLSLFLITIYCEKDLHDRCWVTEVASNGQFKKKWECTQETVSGASCFPSNSLIPLSTGELIEMKDLQLFDKIISVDANQDIIEDKVIGFLHTNSSKIINYIQLFFMENEKIEISPDHVILIKRNNEKQHILAKNVIIGDLLYILTENAWKSINSINYIQNKGIYSPLTLSGYLIVNNVQVSCYANFPKQGIAHLSFLPYRLMYYSLPEAVFGSEYMQAKDEDNLHWYASALMKLSKKMGSQLNYVELSNE